MSEILSRICGTEMEYGFEMNVLPPEESAENVEIYSETDVSPFEDDSIDPEDSFYSDQHDYFCEQLRKSVPEGLYFIGEYGSNGCRYYVDMGHKLEYATPESAGVVDAAHAEFSGEKIVLASATKLTEAGFLAKFPLRKTVAEEGKNTWGYHENYQMKRKVYDEKRHLPFLLAHCATRAVLSGAGRLVLDDSGYSLHPSQKLHDIELEKGNNSTACKALVNTRDEPLSPQRARYARQHLVDSDPNITGRMTIMRLGAVSAVIRLAETRFGNADSVLPRQPVSAAHKVGTDNTAKLDFLMQNGKKQTALDVQECLLEQCESMNETLGLPADEQVALAIWRETLDFMKNDSDKAPFSVEWLAKKKLVERELDRKGLRGTDEDAQLVIRKINNAWDQLDPNLNIGRRWMNAQNPDILTPEEIERLVIEPVHSTRAKARGDFIWKHHGLASELLRANREYQEEDKIIAAAQWDRASVGVHSAFWPHARMNPKV